jgi:CBS domain-containing protein
MSVGEICNRNTVVATEDSSIAEVARLMREHHVGSVVIVEPGVRPKPVGIITDRDLVVEIMASDIDPQRVVVGDAMSFDLVTAQEQDDIWDTLQVMRGKGVRRIPVVDNRGELAGILSIDDVLDYLAEQLSDLVQLIDREQVKEARRRAAL